MLPSRDTLDHENCVKTFILYRCMNDSARKFGIDQLDQATGDGKRRLKRAELAKSVSRTTCRMTISSRAS